MCAARLDAGALTSLYNTSRKLTVRSSPRGLEREDIAVPIRRWRTVATLLVASAVAATLFAGCGGEFEFKPSGSGRGQGVNYQQAPGSLYEATPTPSS